MRVEGPTGQEGDVQYTHIHTNTHTESPGVYFYTPTTNLKYMT